MEDSIYLTWLVDTSLAVFSVQIGLFYNLLPDRVHFIKTEKYLGGKLEDRITATTSQCSQQ
jgi:hypothetical protein